MKKHLSIVPVFFVLMAMASTLQAQSLNERLQQLSGIASKKYIAPAVNTFGANYNGGWFNRPPAAKVLGLDFEVGIVAMGSFFKDEEKRFSTDGNFRFTRDQAQKLTESVTDPAIKEQLISQIISRDFNVAIGGPTVTGSKKENIQVTFAPRGSETFLVTDPRTQQSMTVSLPTRSIKINVKGALENFSMLPAAAPQIKIGTVYGTQMLLRYLPGINMPEDLGKLDFIGFGLQHNPGVWLKTPLPVDISLGFMTQKITLADLLKITGTAYGINVSRTFGTGLVKVTPFAGFILEKTNVEVDYTSTFDSEAGKEEVNIKFDMESENKNRVNLGAAVQLGSVSLILDYNIGKYKALTAGLMYNFGFIL
ncbi:MAG: DUF6588 family protein [Bacteroidota bacterium]